jgi:hypothetical protein
MRYANTQFTAVAALLVVFSASAASLTGQTVDRTDPSATAAAVLSAYQAREVEALAPLANRDNRELLLELSAQGEQHPRYQSIFSGWRWDAVHAWDGVLGEVRYRNAAEALVSFAELGPDEIAVVVLTWEEGGWAFEDVNSPSRARFEALNKTRPPQE